MLNSKGKDRVLAVLSDRFLFGMPFIFIGLIGFLLGIQLNKSRDSLISIAITISIIYLAANTYLIKMVQKGAISPIIYGTVITVYFALLTAYFYKKR
ncbi:MAG: hypothetical protein Q9M89_00265 [Persephonella sp.]|nr:hypothetical protein [Persephonella sp.]